MTAPSRADLPPDPPDEWITVAEARGVPSAITELSDCLSGIAVIDHPLVSGSEPTPVHDPANGLMSLLLFSRAPLRESLPEALAPSHDATLRFWAVDPSHSRFIASVRSGGELVFDDERIRESYPSAHAWGLACASVLALCDFAWTGEFAYCDDPRLFPCD